MSQSKRASVKTLLRTVSNQVAAVSFLHPGSRRHAPPHSPNLGVLPPTDLRSLAPPPAPNILQLCITLTLALIVWQRWPTPHPTSTRLTLLLRSSAKPNPPLYQRKGMNYFLSRQRSKRSTTGLLCPPACQSSELHEEPWIHLSRKSHHRVRSGGRVALSLSLVGALFARPRAEHSKCVHRVSHD